MVDLNKVKAALEFHKENNPGVKIIKVTTTRYYAIPKYAAKNSEEILKEWFEKYDATSSHAFRDGSLLIQHFNNDAIIQG